MKKIAFFDIDGTLVSFKTHEVPASTVCALTQLRKNGVLLYIASGRPLYMIPPFLRDGIGDFDGFDGMLCNSGQVCLDERGIFRMSSINPEDVAILDEANKRGNFDLVFMLGDRAVVRTVGPQIREAEKRANITFEYEPDFDPTRHAVYQMNAFIPPSQDHVITDIAPHVKLVRWAPDFADVIPFDGGKDLGVNAVLTHYGLSTKDAYAFGDGGNDATMLACVGCGVAMGNAAMEAKEVAKLITTSVDDDGIYKACVHMGLIEDVLNLCASDHLTKIIIDKQGNEAALH